MRKITLILMIFFLTLSVFGCSSKNPNRDILIAINQQSRAINENTKVMKKMIAEKEEKKKGSKRYY